MIDIKLIPKQRLVLELIMRGYANEILYGGAAGGGKSYLLRAMAIIFAIYIPGVQIFLFRRKVKDLVATHLHGPTSFPIILDDYVKDRLCKINNSNNYIAFENGSRISLNHCQHDADLNNFLSAEIHILLLDESTTFTEKMIRFLRGRLRLGSLPVPEEFRKCLPFIIYGTNPRGSSHHYFKRNFVDFANPMTPFRAPLLEGRMKRIFVPSLLKDNPHIEKDYADKLYGLGDADLVDAYLDGDWSVVEGAALTLSRDYHVKSHKLCSLSWQVKRGYDYGFSAPYSVLHYMVSTGESETSWCPPKGSIIFHTEMYGADDQENGLKEDVSVTAKKIKAHESVVYPYTTVKPGPADNAIFSKEQGPSIHETILEATDKLIEFYEGDKSPGSRVLGLEEIRKYLYNSIHFPLEKPGMYFTDLCPKLFSHLTSITLDEKKVDDVDSDCIDHDYDVVRYVTLDKSKEITQIPATGR